MMSYGIHPESVPKGLRAEVSRKNSGARFLSFEKSREFESASLDRFPPASGGVLD